MINILVKSPGRVELTGKTVATSGVAVQKSTQSPERKLVSDPFFEVKSPRASDGDRVTVTLLRL